MANSESFKLRYGPWALVAGGAAGIGAGYVRYAAAQGLNVVIVDKDAATLDTFVKSLRSEYSGEFLPITVDLADADVVNIAQQAIGGREIGLLVYNAALADVGPFYKDTSEFNCDGLQHELNKIAINMSSPLQFVYRFARPMLQRRRGGIILMSSGTGFQGAPYYAHYGATKAYNIVLAEGLWYEFKPYDVDVLSCVAGLTKSPAMERSIARGEAKGAFFQTPDQVAAEGMAMLGKVPSWQCGAPNRRLMLMLKLLPRRLSVRAIGQHAIDHFLGKTQPSQKLD
jgi:short-subunit dehydrogenase